MRWYRTVKLGLHDSCELCAFINLAGWGRFQRTPVECVCVFARLRELGTVIEFRAHVAFHCMCVCTFGIIILPGLPCCLPLCYVPVLWCSAAIQGSVLVGGQLGIIGTK